MRWLEDGPPTYDTVHSKNITTSKETDVLDITPGMECSALFKGTTFGVEVIACGKIQLHIIIGCACITLCCNSEVAEKL